MNLSGKARGQGGFGPAAGTMVVLSAPLIRAITTVVWVAKADAYECIPDRNIDAFVPNWGTLWC